MKHLSEGRKMFVSVMVVFAVYALIFILFEDYDRTHLEPFEEVSDWHLLLFSLVVMVGLAFLLHRYARRMDERISREQAAKENQMRRELTQNIAHELKTPVASILGYTDTILDNPQMTPETQRQFIERTNAQAHRLTALLQDISTLNRMDFAAHQLTMERTDVSAIVGDIVQETVIALEKLYTTDGSQHLTAESTYQIKSNAYSFGCCFAEVEVDIPMCRVRLLNIVNVHDCGQVINPMLAAGQVHGGQSMGIGYALSEKLMWDEKTGRPLNNNLLDYKMSSFMDHPRLNAAFVENYEPTSAYGTKGLGEPPVCPVAPAIRNAIGQATGLYINELPLSPHTLFREFTDAGLINDSFAEEKQGKESR